MSICYPYVIPVAVAASYTGPGDIVSSALAWWGLRAYNAAAIGQNAVRLVRASDSAEQNFVTLASGALDVASIVTFLASTTGKVVTMFDQSGNGKDITQTTDTKRPAFTLNYVGSLPVAQFDGTDDRLVSSSGITQAFPFTLSAVATRISTGDTNGNYIISSAGDAAVLFSGSSITLSIYSGGSQIIATAARNTLHRVQGVYIASAANSSFYLDSDAAVTGNIGVTSMSGNVAWGGFGGAEILIQACAIGESGYWGSAFDATQASNMELNQKAFWGL